MKMETANTCSDLPNVRALTCVLHHTAIWRAACSITFPLPDVLCSCLKICWHIFFCWSPHMVSANWFLTWVSKGLPLNFFFFILSEISWGMLVSACMLIDWREATLERQKARRLGGSGWLKWLRICLCHLSLEEILKETSATFVSMRICLEGASLTCAMKKTPKKLLLILMPFDSMSLCQAQVSVTVMVLAVSKSDVVPEARCS